MAKRPKNYKYIPATDMLPSPMLATVKSIANALHRRKSKKYKPKPKPKSDTEKLMNESRRKYAPRPPAGEPPSKPRDEVKRKKSPPKRMKPMKVYKTAKGGRIDGIAIRGKTKGTIR